MPDSGNRIVAISNYVAVEKTLGGRLERMPAVATAREVWGAPATGPQSYEPTYGSTRSAARTRRCVVLAGFGVREVAKFMGRGNTTTTERSYTHLFDTDDHSAAVAALDALDSFVGAGNVVPMWG